MLANMCDSFFTYNIFILDSSLLDYIHYETQFYPHFLTTPNPEKSQMSSSKSPDPNPDPINPAILLLKHLILLLKHLAAKSSQPKLSSQWWSLAEISDNIHSSQPFSTSASSTASHPVWIFIMTLKSCPDFIPNCMPNLIAFPISYVAFRKTC